MLSVNPSQPTSISQQAFLGTTWAGVAISLLFLVFRLTVRLKFFRRLFIDDPVVIAAWLMTLANAVIWQASVGPLYLTVDVTSGRITSLPSDFETKFFAYSHAQFASYILYYASLYSTKLSFLLFFRKLGDKVRGQRMGQRMLWWCALVFVIASYAVSFSLVDFMCLVGPKDKALAECSSSHAAHYEGISLRTAATLDIVTDALIILVSTNVLWKVKIPLPKKLALTGICSLTAFVIGVSIVRVVVSTSGPHLDIIKQIFWANLELSVAIIVACLASFRTLYTKSKPQKYSSPKVNSSARARLFPKGTSSLVPELPEGNATRIFADNDTFELKRWQNTTSSEERILPLNSVYVRQDFSVLPEPPRASGATVDRI